MSDWTVCLSGEIHTDRRARIRSAAMAVAWTPERVARLPADVIRGELAG